MFVPASPNTFSWVIWLLVLCWPSPLMVLIVVLLTTAFNKRWVKLDTSQAPKFNWRRNV
jgi:hypothetical protein